MPNLAENRKLSAEASQFLKPPSIEPSLEGVLDSHECGIGVVRPKFTLHHIGVTNSNLKEANR